MKPLVVGIGGTLRQGSTTEKALRFALDACALAGARTELFSGRLLDVPIYDPDDNRRTPAVRRLVDAMRAADGLILATPAYHGGPSGLIKNVLDYAEDTVADIRPYLDGRAVGVIVAASGTQALGTTLTAVRSVIHALRGWPTPLAVALNSLDKPFGDSHDPDKVIADQLHLVAQQVVSFARWQMAGHNNISRIREPALE
jgi:FMN reductase